MEKGIFQSLPDLVSLARNTPGKIMAEIIESAINQTELSLKENKKIEAEEV